MDTLSREDKSNVEYTKMVFLILHAVYTCDKKKLLFYCTHTKYVPGIFEGTGAHVVDRIDRSIANPGNL